MMIERKCKWCGKQFTPAPTKQGNPQKYCSQTCRVKGYTKAKIEANRKYRKKHQGKQRKCRWCGTQFLSINGRCYCSIQCKKEARREQNLLHQLRYRVVHGKDEKQKYFDNLGTSNLREHCYSNFEDELKLVKKEIRRLHIWKKV